MIPIWLAIVLCVACYVAGLATMYALETWALNDERKDPRWPRKGW